ncbi:peptidase C19 family protein [Tieghemostelium lacteum]|uniref:Ubiquitin carboxyl-terminal hydrolase n=1 Tax=Tieghemostelium lacteum TaxID=361077 RepID=A0A152A8R3_TIELA|nr:peptidase C19 family protein [Tieghemostelium lacteum]|eukprot:KYR02447.1 peptidase C19 family protein [Tieghemostelium lacteum]
MNQLKSIFNELESVNKKDRIKSSLGEINNIYDFLYEYLYYFEERTLNKDKESYWFLSFILKCLFERYHNDTEFNIILSNYFSNLDTTQNLLVPLLDNDIIAFLEIYYIVLQCKLYQSTTQLDSSDLTFSFQSIKSIITKYHNSLNIDILKIQSDILILLIRSNVKFYQVFKVILTPLVNIYIRFLSKISIYSCQVETEYNAIVGSFVGFILLIWNQNSQLQLSSIEQSLRMTFQMLIEHQQQNDDSMDSQMIVNNSHQDPLQSLSNMFNSAPVELIPRFLSNIYNEQVPDSTLFKVIIHFTQWPLEDTIAKWILDSFNALIEKKRVTLLSALVVNCAEKVIKQMFQLELMSGSFAILERMLLGYQHSPDTFHSIIKLFPIVIKFLHTYNQKLSQVSEVEYKNESIIIPYRIQSSVYQLQYRVKEGRDLLLFALKNVHQPQRFKSTIADILSRFCQLSWILMFHHTGYPELYLPLQDSLTSINSQPPSEFEIKRILLANAWTSLDSVVFENQALGRVLKDRGGLVNLGNTCYMNSFLQALYMTIPFRQYLLNNLDSKLLSFYSEYSDLSQEEFLELYQQDLLKRPQFLKQLQLVFGSLRLSVKQACSPGLFQRTLDIEYRSGQQQDSFEFGKSLLDNLDEILKQLERNENQLVLNKQLSSPTFDNTKEKRDKLQEDLKLKNSKVQSIVTKMFGGKISTSIICRQCKTNSTKIEDFLELPLSFGSNLQTDGQIVELEQMIKDFLSDEALEGDNKYFCDHCKSLQDADKSISIIQSPQHLILVIKRFYFSRQLKSVSKILNPVDYPFEITLKSVIPPTLEENQQEPKPNTKPKSIEELYSLYSVIMHSGRSVNHGHYYNYSKSSDNISNSSDWCMFNDSSVSIADQKSFVNISKRFHTDVPYILFYSKKSTSDNNSNNNNNANEVTPWISTQIERENQTILSKYNNTRKNTNNILEQFQSYDKK